MGGVPDVKIGRGAAQRILAAATPYVSELQEIVGRIGAQAAQLGEDPEQYVPRQLAQELDLAEGIVRWATLQVQPDSHAGLFPESIRTDILQVMASALTLHREDLAIRLRSLEADPLSLPEEREVLIDRLSVLEEELGRFWQQYGTSPGFGTVRARLLLKEGLRYPAPVAVEAAQAAGEGQEIEFKEHIPNQVRDLAHVFAGFASSNPGTVFLGIADDGSIVGVVDAATNEERDKLRSRIDGICSNNIRPPVRALVDFIDVDGKTVVRIQVPRGASPVYYVEGKPYVRHGAMSRPAQPEEVEQLIRRSQP